MWQEWLNGILGIALIVYALIAQAASIPQGTDTVLLILGGIAIAVLGFWGAAQKK